MGRLQVGIGRPGRFCGLLHRDTSMSTEFGMLASGSSGLNMAYYRRRHSKTNPREANIYLASANCSAGVKIR
jgi:hypothetical protein